jgi:hypothetical protein
LKLRRRQKKRKYRQPVTTNTKQSIYWSLGVLIIGLITPSAIIFCLEVFVGDINPLVASRDILHRQFAGGHNLFLIALLDLIPFALLSMICLVAARKLTPSGRKYVTLGGLLGILACMVPGHVAVWYPLYSGGHMSSTAVIAFLFIPFYCIPTLCVGVAIGWVVAVKVRSGSGEARSDQESN